jgi:hypothetical protein
LPIRLTEGQDRRQLIPAPVELDTQKADVGHTFDQRPQQPLAALLDHLHRFGALHFGALSTVKAPVAMATGRVSSSSVATARTKATLRVTW